jgi:hypothetical protein
VTHSAATLRVLRQPQKTEERKMRKLVAVLFFGMVAGLMASDAGAQTLLSGMGGMCLNAEGGLRPGARLIVWPCSGGSNELWTIGRPRGINDTRIYTPNATTTAFDGSIVPYCVEAQHRDNGAQLFARPCDNNKTSLQNFAWRGGNTVGHNSGRCLDVLGGWGAWGIANTIGAAFGNRNVPVGLYNCHGGYEQQWFRAEAPRRSVPASVSRFSIAGRAGSYTFRNGQFFRIEANGQMVAAGGLNLIGPDGGTLVAAGGGNIVAAGGGNIVAAGAGN